ncbi:hypothetical protein E2K93_07395 [Thalassotalea sp. HSM 43]|uniref:glycoside hydrolase family 2 protein n=1 Tax=Thalassotalea sp. HSM 43 TaxID=2552945 RepID=UPI001080D8AF|nr:sugar-binding domain-containing protein [Thalassotalea sp. HSM 43]QBY04221.1 hypothetical protein E2K93_07395 [Thalassotalea sp. HSM 43]
MTTIKQHIQHLGKVFISIIMLCLCGQAAAQVQHQNTMSLDGVWQIYFDKDNQGKAKKLYQSANFLALDDVRDINVPSVWERIEKDYEGAAIYHKRFDAPKAWQEQIIHLAFDAVNYRAEVYLNDHVVGVHEGGFTPFSFRIDSLLHFDQENVITVRVLGPILLDTDKVIDGMGAMETPQWRGGITGGIWQSVRLVASDGSYISDVFVQPDLGKESANITVSTTNFDVYDSDDSIRFEIRDKQTDSLVASKQISAKLQPGKSEWQTNIDIANAKAWSPDAPNLYQLTTQIIRDDKISDSVTENFGLRQFTVKDKRFYLNDEEVYVKAVFLEGVYPVGVATPVDMDMARKEIRLAKEAGFNMIRPWRRPPPPQWLDLADEMGVMVIGSPVLECMDLPVNTPDLPNRVINEIAKTIKRDRNRASIVMWELFNEIRRPVLKQMMQETSMMARDLDPSRLILDESGGWAFGAKVFLPNERNFISFNDVHTYPGPNMTNTWYDKFAGLSYNKKERKQMGINVNPIGDHVKPGATTFVSELGYGSYVDFDKVNQRFEDVGNPIVPPTRYHQQLGSQLTEVLQNKLSHIYSSPQDFYMEQQLIHGKANARMIEATRINPRVTGYCVHALTGGDWIMGAGLLDLWRDPKPQVYKLTQAANQKQIVSIRTFPRNVYQGNDMRFTIKGVNELATQQAKLAVEIRDQQNQVVYQHSENVTYRKDVSDLFEYQLNSKELTGRYTIVAKMLTKDGKLITENQFDFDVFTPQNYPVSGDYAFIDHTGNLKAFFNDNNINATPFNADTSIDTPVVVAMHITGKDSQIKVNPQLNAFANQGGTVLYLQFPYNKPKWNAGVLSKGKSLNLPVEIAMKASTGLWGGMSHIVEDHPMFEGLPVKQAMHGVYEHVRAKMSMVDLEQKALVTVVANDNFPDMTLMNRHYKGTGDVWLGSDVSEITLGQGKIILSTLQTVPNLGKDPVADIIVRNMLAYIGK